MPRYSYVVAFPVLIAICVGVNIQRYPAVSAMLRGESVESHWLGRSGVFDFQAKPTGESKSYQSYRSDSDPVTDSRTSRTPIPLSDSFSSPATSTPPLQSTSSSQSIMSSRSTSIFQSGVASINSTERGNDSRYNGSYDSDFYRSRSGDMGSTGLTDFSSTENNSYGRDNYSRQSDSYESRPFSDGSNGLADTFSSIDPYNSSYRSDTYSNSYGDSYQNSYNTSSSPSWNDDRNNYDKPEDRNDNINYTGNRSESRTSSDSHYSWPDYYDSGSNGENTFRKDSPLPGYSSQYPATNETTSIPVTPMAATSNVTDIDTATVAETEPTTPQTRRPLSLQEKLELRLATPFSFSPSGSQDASSEQYIPPDFLPPHENGIVGKLVNPSAEPAVTISPVTFISGATPVTSSSALPETTTTSPENEEGNEIMP